MFDLLLGVSALHYQLEARRVLNVGFSSCTVPNYPLLMSGISGAYWKFQRGLEVFGSCPDLELIQN